MTPPWVPRRLVPAADILAALFACCSVLLLVTGRIRGVVSGTTLSVDWAEMAFVAAAVAVVRHAASPRPPMLVTLARWADAVRQRPALRDTLLAFWLTRPTVLLVGLLAVSTVGLAPTETDTLTVRHRGEALAARWDAQWYAGIAANGYEWRQSYDPQQNLAFFPAYPILIHVVGLATGALGPGIPPDRQIARLTWCGLAISLAAFFWAAWYFALLSREILGDARGRNAVMLLAAFPFALFFSAAYTESLFLLAALGAWFHFRRGDIMPAILWGLLAGLTRPNGCFLSLPLGLLALGVPDAPIRTLVAAGRRRSPAVRLCLAAMPTVGMLLFTAYAYQLTGAWFAWARTHAAWGRTLGAGASVSIVSGLAELRSGGLIRLVLDHPYDTLNALGLLFAVALLRPVWRLSPAWAIFVLVSVAVPFSAGGLLSMGRLTSTLFPVFLACAAILPPGTGAAVAAAFAIVQGLLATLFYTWRNVY